LSSSPDEAERRRGARDEAPASGAGEEDMAASRAAGAWGELGVRRAALLEPSAAAKVCALQWWW
jgi:hypothetical protein